MAEIMVEDAAVKRMTVKIDTVTVNGKSMTLSIFKQVPFTRYTKLFQGKKSDKLADGVRIWGWANYFPEASMQHTGGSSILFSMDGKLFRTNESLSRLERICGHKIDQLFISGR